MGGAVGMGEFTHSAKDGSGVPSGSPAADGAAPASSAPSAIAASGVPAGGASARRAAGRWGGGAPPPPAPSPSPPPPAPGSGSRRWPRRLPPDVKTALWRGRCAPAAVLWGGKGGTAASRGCNSALGGVLLLQASACSRPKKGLPGPGLLPAWGGSGAAPPAGADALGGQH